MASALEEIKRMQKQGISEDQIIANLRERGVPHKDILEALSQTKIKAAVEQPEPESDVPMPSGARKSFSAPEVSGDDATMQGSIMNEEQAQQAQVGEGYQSPSYSSVPAPQQTQDYGYDNSQQYEYTPGTSYPDQNYNQGYDSYAPNLSSDIVSEISEQVVSEKLSEIRRGVEKIMDFKTTMESNVESLTERLARIEKIIDSLQNSVLRKTGDYMTNIEDIKKEIIETQKTFGKLLPEFRKELEGHKGKSKKSK